MNFSKHESPLNKSNKLLSFTSGPKIGNRKGKLLPNSNLLTPYIGLKAIPTVEINEFIEKAQNADPVPSGAVIKNGKYYHSDAQMDPKTFKVSLKHPYG